MCGRNHAALTQWILGYPDKAVEKSRDSLTLVVRDEGDGFDISSVPDPTDPENLLRASGRGLYLMGTFMDEIIHNDVGNMVTMIKKLPTDGDGGAQA